MYNEHKILRNWLVLKFLYIRLLQNMNNFILTGVIFESTGTIWFILLEK